MVGTKRATQREARTKEKGTEKLREERLKGKAKLASEVIGAIGKGTKERGRGMTYRSPEWPFPRSFLRPAGV